MPFSALSQRISGTDQQAGDRRRQVRLVGDAERDLAVGGGRAGGEGAVREALLGVHGIEIAGKAATQNPLLLMPAVAKHLAAGVQRDGVGQRIAGVLRGSEAVARPGLPVAKNASKSSRIQVASVTKVSLSDAFQVSTRR